jgi:ATP-binding cassette subfamily C protein
MFDKRLMQMCPESKKYIAGNIVLQWLELCLNALMIGMIAYIVQTLYLAVSGTAAGANAAGTAFSMQKILLMGAVFILIIALRFAAVRAANRMSFLASRTVKKKMREMIYAKLLKLGTAYREQVTTAELVQESVEDVDQLESYFGLYVPQFFYAFIAPVTLFILFAAAGSWQTGLILLIFVPLIPGTIMMVQKIAKRILAKYWDQYAQLGSTFLENLQGMTTLKIYQADAFKNEQMNEESENFRRVTMKVLTMQLNSIIIMDLLGYFPKSSLTLGPANDGGNRVKECQKCCIVLLLFRHFLTESTSGQKKRQNNQQRNCTFHYCIALAIRAWKPPTAMVTELTRSASVGLVPSSTAMPATSAAVLPVT